MSLLKEAGKLFKNKEFEEAYRLYKQAASLYGEEVVAYNLDKCAEKILLNNESKLVKAEVNGKELTKNNNLDKAFKALGVDNYYIVNLKRRPDRKIKAKNEFKRHGMRPIFINAEDALVSEEALFLYKRYKNRAAGLGAYSHHISNNNQQMTKNIVSIGVFAYILSQKKVILDAINKGYKKICVFDDDIFFTDAAVKQIHDYSKEKNNNWKILLLGASEYFYQSENDFRDAVGKSMVYNAFPGQTCGSFGMVYDESIYSELLTVLSDADGTFDNNILGFFYNKYQGSCHVFNPNICIPSVDESDIREGNRNQETHARRMLWDNSNYSRWKKELRVSVIVTNLETISYVPSFKTLDKLDISLSIYYISKEDGLRPLIAGKSFQEGLMGSKDIQNSFEVLTKSEQISELTKLGLPYSDITIVWPSYQTITEDAIRNFCLSDNLEKEKRVILNTGIKGKKNLTSIIIPSYRPVKQIWPTVKSALHQKNVNFEVIVVNDNPNTINFIEDLNHYVDNDTELKLVNLKIVEHTVNRNASSARNTGLFLSRGEYISFLDDDDIFTPERSFNAQKSLEHTNSSIGATYCGYHGSWNGHLDETRFKEGNLGKEVFALNYGTHYMCTNSVTYKRDTFVGLGGFNESYKRHQDLELSARFFRNNNINSNNNFDVMNRPNPVDSTFNANVKSLLDLKMKFINDFSQEIQEMSSETIDTVIKAHAEDIYKSLNISESEKLLIFNLLKNTLTLKNTD